MKRLLGKDWEIAKGAGAKRVVRFFFFGGGGGVSTIVDEKDTFY